MFPGRRPRSGAMLRAMLPNLLVVLRDAALLKSAPAEQPLPPAPEAPPKPSGPPRRVEGRIHFREMLWRPELELLEEEKLVVSAKAGLPHCADCEQALALETSPREQWTCRGCGRSHPGVDADFFAADSVVAMTLKAFFAAKPDFSPAPALSAPKSA